MRAARSEWYAQIWESAAAELGAEATRRGELIEVRLGASTTWLDHSVTDLDGPATVRAVTDKRLVTEQLGAYGLPTPDSWCFTPARLREAFAFVREHDRCLVKPQRITPARSGITPNVTTMGGLRRAIARSAVGGTDLVVQEQIDGAVIRVLVLDDEILDAVWMRPPAVAGDGLHAIWQLVDAENELRREQGLARAESLLDIDLDLTSTIKRFDLKIGSVLGEGQRIDVKTVVFQNTRADVFDITSSLHPDAAELARAAARAVGVRLAGVDLILAHPAAPPSEGRGVVLDVNAHPGLFHHQGEAGNRVAASILDRCLTTREIGHL